MFMICMLWPFRGGAGVTDTDTGTALNHVWATPNVGSSPVTRILVGRRDAMTCKWVNQ